ncbi:MAG: IS66 family transposase [Gammaproteobacteria bacterium]
MTDSRPVEVRCELGQHDRAVEVRERVSFPPARPTAGESGNTLSASTQWAIVEESADVVKPAYEELIRQAAQGEVLHNDDTPMKILALMEERLTTQHAQEGDAAVSRTGIFTSGIVSTREKRAG